MSPNRCSPCLRSKETRRGGRDLKKNIAQQPTSRCFPLGNSPWPRRIRGFRHFEVVLFFGVGGPLAQLVEHHTFNVRVAGSSPARLISPSILSELFLMLRPVGLALRGLQIAASS